MPKYKCHKEVHALKIVDVDPVAAVGGATLAVEGPFGAIAEPKDWLIQHQPQPGGYYVVYKDGYSSFSPAEAFEEGYARSDVTARPAPAVTSDLENRFTYHPPIGDQPERYVDLRSHFLALAMKIDALVPTSREKSVSFTHLETAGFWANAGIARNEDEATVDLRPDTK